MDEIKKTKDALGEQERKRDELARAYTTLSMTASHVFRKAEKIATKQRHPSEVAALQRVMDLLSDHTVPEPGDLVSALTMACPIAERMIGAGEIVLKNKEERGIFSDTETFCSEMRTACMEVRNQETECRNIQDVLSLHPVRVKMNTMEREKIQLEHMLEKEALEHKELTEWRAKIVGKIPLLEEELHNKIEEIMGKGVQLRFDDPMKV